MLSAGLLFLQLEDIGSMVDGIRGCRGHAVGIAVGDVPGLIQLVERVRRAREIRGDRPGADIDCPFSLHGIGGVEYSCDGIIRIKLKYIAGKSRSYITVILLISRDIPQAICYIGYNRLLFRVLNEILT